MRAAVCEAGEQGQCYAVSCSSTSNGKNIAEKKQNGHRHHAEARPILEP
jgi:hypothetical protein